MATEFICTTNKTGEDYGLISEWEAQTEVDLTVATTIVFAHGGITGTIGDDASVTGASSGATGTVVHATSTQILIISISGTFTSGEAVEVDGSNYVTISDVGDSAICTLECYSDDGDMNNKTAVGGATTSATNYRKITVPEGHRHTGKIATGFHVTNGGSYNSDAISINEIHFVLEWVSAWGNNYSSGISAWMVGLGSEGCYIRNCIAFEGEGFSSRGSFQMVNCIMWSGTNTVYLNYPDTNAEQEIYNCTIIGYGVSPAITIQADRGNQYFKNCIVFGTTSFGFIARATATDANATYDGQGNVTGITDIYFADNAGTNYLLSSDATLVYDAGVNLGTSFENINFDIKGRDRVAEGDTWDIGANEYVSSGGGTTTASSPLQQVSFTVNSPILSVIESRVVLPSLENISINVGTAIASTLVIVSATATPTLVVSSLDLKTATASSSASVSATVTPIILQATILVNIPILSVQGNAIATPTLKRVSLDLKSPSIISGASGVAQPSLVEVMLTVETPTPLISYSRIALPSIISSRLNVNSPYAVTIQSRIAQPDLASVTLNVYSASGSQVGLTGIEVIIYGESQINKFWALKSGVN